MVWIFLGFVGLCLGSFVNAFVWRVHEQETLKKKKAKDLGKKLRELSITKGRSMCPHCHHTLAAKDLIPVISWLSLRGKCRYCKEPIPDSPLIEASVAAAVLISYAAWPYVNGDWTILKGVTFALWLVLLTGFAALTVYDLRWYLLPNRMVWPMTGIGLVFIACKALASDHPENVLLGSAVGIIVVAGLFYGLYQLSQGKWIGGGDVKLAILLGLLASGFAESLLLLFIASTAGTLYSLYIGLTGRQKLTRTLRIPFGPFLVLGACVVVLVGTHIIDWYTNLLV